MSAAYDVVIVGGGIVGLATARALLSARPLRLVVLEAEEAVARHQTGHNSGVIHAGLYYQPGSLKAVNCTEGRELLYAYCRERGLVHERCGKLVVATHEGQREALAELGRRGAANGLAGIRRLAAEELRAFEPAVAGVEGLHVPQTGIVDFKDVAAAYAEDVVAAGGEIRTGSRLVAVRKEGGVLTLDTARGSLTARALINCAGLQSDRVARLCGLRPALRIIPFRGEYYQLKPERRGLVRNLIYPVPDPRFPFLGVHFTRLAKGGVEAGPNAVLALKREGYGWGAISLRDLAEMVCYPGFWRMAARYGKTGFGEAWRSLHKAAFVKALQRLVPGLEADDLAPGGAGVRAQAVAPNGMLVDDFCVQESARMIHVLNAPSPAATASLSIGEATAARALDRF